MQDGTTNVFRHYAPDVSTHYYQPDSPREPLLLYQGAICSPASEAEDDAYQGDVWLRWEPKPHVEARGMRPTTPERFGAFMGRSSRPPQGIWVDRRTIRLPGDRGVPPIPLTEAMLEADYSTQQFSEPIYPPEIGDGTELTKVSGLLINGFQGHDGMQLAAPSDRRWLHRGRTCARGAGWVVTLDDLSTTNPGLWDVLESSGGYAATHIVSLVRENSATFTAEQATDALEAVTCALNLAIGRRIDIAVPVGWQDDEPVWTKWTAGQAEAFGPTHTWLDPMITSRQIGETIGRVLDCWSDSLRRETLFYASSYYLQALSQYAETGTSNAVSGLLLLASSWLVEEKEVCTRTAWDKKKTAQGQIRMLLDMPECRINAAVPCGFNYLAEVAQKIYESRERKGACPDGLDCIIRMRNDVVHPTHKRRGGWTYQEWIEAHNLVAHFLELSLLSYIGYTGQYHPRIAMERMTGYVEYMPWSGC